MEKKITKKRMFSSKQFALLRFQYGPMLLMPTAFPNILMEPFNVTPHHPVSLKVA